MKMKNYRLTNEEAQLLKQMEQNSGLSSIDFFRKKVFKEQQGLELLEIKMQEEIKKLEDKIDLRFTQNSQILTKLFDALKLIGNNLKK